MIFKIIVTRGLLVKSIIFKIIISFFSWINFCTLQLTNLTELLSSKGCTPWILLRLHNVSKKVFKPYICFGNHISYITKIRNTIVCRIYKLICANRQFKLCGLRITDGCMYILSRYFIVEKYDTSIAPLATEWENKTQNRLFFFWNDRIFYSRTR